MRARARACACIGYTVIPVVAKSLVAVILLKRKKMANRYPSRFIRPVGLIHVLGANFLMCLVM